MARIWVHRIGVGPTAQSLGDGLLIGRGDHCDLILDDETVSTDHAEVRRRGTSYLITDLGGRNGTVLNGRQIDGATRLSPGDVVQIGPFRLELDLPKVKRTQPRQALTVELTADEQAIARVLVARYREENTFAPRPATQREIAERLHLSESTVKRCLKAMAAKLELIDEPPRDRTRMVADRVIALGLDRD